MRKILLIIAAVALVGCDSGPKWEPDAGNPQSVIIEQAIRKHLKKPTGKLSKGDLKKVTSLSFKFTKITDAGLKDVTKFPQLTLLSLKNTPITDNGLKEVAKLHKIEWLDISATKITDTGLKELANLTQLNYLEMSGTEVTDTGLKELVALKNLTRIGLSGTKITDEGLQQLVKLKKLESIALIASDATAVGVSRLQEKLPDCRIHYQSRSEFTALMKESGLELAANKRSIIANSIIEAAIRYELEKPTGELTSADLGKVTKLTISESKLTDVKDLENLTQLKELKVLDNKLTKVPAGLEKLTKLESLDLSVGKLTEVKGLEKLTQLKYLWITGNPDLTRAQIDQLQKALPKCFIHSNPTK